MGRNVEFEWKKMFLKNLLTIIIILKSEKKIYEFKILNVKDTFPPKDVVKYNHMIFNPLTSNIRGQISPYTYMYLIKLLWRSY